MRPKYRTSIVPRFSDFDLQGILNSRQYLDLVGEARTDQMKRCYKVPLETFTNRGQTFVLRTFEIAYEKPIYYGTAFDIETWVDDVRGPMAEILFRFVSPGDDVIYANGSARYFLVDCESRKPVEFSEEIRRVYLGD